jgi:hypothetical protein
MNAPDLVRFGPLTSETFERGCYRPNRARRRLTYGGNTAPRQIAKAPPKAFVQHPLAFAFANTLWLIAERGRKLGPRGATPPRRKAGAGAGSFGKGLIAAQTQRQRAAIEARRSSTHDTGWIEAMKEGELRRA